MKQVLLSLIVALAFAGGGVAAMSKIVGAPPAVMVLSAR
jgi:hypothetical protein